MRKNKEMITLSYKLGKVEEHKDGMSRIIDKEHHIVLTNSRRLFHFDSGLLIIDKKFRSIESAQRIYGWWLEENKAKLESAIAKLSNKNVSVNNWNEII